MPKELDKNTENILKISKLVYIICIFDLWMSEKLQKRI